MSDELLLFTDPDGDGVGDWSTTTDTPVGDLATVAYVDAKFAYLIGSPAFQGIPTAFTPAQGMISKQVANTEYVNNAISLVQNALVQSISGSVNSDEVDSIKVRNTKPAGTAEDPIGTRILYVVVALP